MPLEVCHTHFLAGTIVDTAEDVHTVVKVSSAVEEASKRHGGKLDELESLQVQYHSIFGTRAVVVPAQDYNLVARD